MRRFNMDVSDLVSRSKRGEVSSSEIRAVAERLRLGPADSDTYNLIYVLGRSFAFEYEDLIAEHLDYPRDPWVARCALQVLCRMWDRHETYLSWLRRFVAGVGWDVDGVVRQIAMASAGEYLREHEDVALWQLILGRADDSNESDLERRIATDAIAEALGASAADVLKSRGAARDSRSWEARTLERGRIHLAAIDPENVASAEDATS